MALGQGPRLDEADLDGKQGRATSRDLKVRGWCGDGRTKEQGSSVVHAWHYYYCAGGVAIDLI